MLRSWPNALGPRRLNTESVGDAQLAVGRLAGRSAGPTSWCARNSGATLAAQAGATLAELMNRLGHTTVTEALIYQHAAAGRDAEIARRLSAIANAAEASTAV